MNLRAAKENPLRAFWLRTLGCLSPLTAALTAAISVVLTVVLWSSLLSSPTHSAEVTGTTAANPSPRGLPSVDLLKSLDEGFVAVFQEVAPSVVVIESDKRTEEDSNPDDFGMFFHDESGKPFQLPKRPSHREGSGFVVREDGYILTNFHVISESDHISVKLKNGKRYPATISGIDDKTDIAILKIASNGLPAVRFADSDAVRVGQLVCAIGVPYNLEYSFTCGWVSAKGRAGLTDTFYEDYIQTDAFINPGNSGGPLIDVQGRVIGMNTLINGIGRGLAFAIPSNMLQEVSAQLISSGEVIRPWLGIRMKELDEFRGPKDQFKGIETGVLVDLIEPNTPAAIGDLRPTDVITQIDGVRVERSRDLQREVLKKKVGQEVKLSVWRAGKSMDLILKTAQLPSRAALRANAAPLPTPAKTLEFLGLKLGAPMDGKADSAPGVRVTDVAAESIAAQAGVEANDIITDIDQQPVRSVDQAKELLTAADLGRGTLLFLNRSGQKTYAILRMEE